MRPVWKYAVAVTITIIPIMALRWRIETLSTDASQDAFRSALEVVPSDNGMFGAPLSFRIAPVEVGTPKFAHQRTLGPKRIKHLALVAERHSGSTWMLQVLRSYFRGNDIHITATLCTWKHWFQSRIHEDIQNGKRTCRPSQPCPACHDTEHTLVVVLWRNPYDWIVGMSRVPHHAKAHAGLEGNLALFLSKPWTATLTQEQLAAIASRNPEKECIDNFLPSEVFPCEPNNRKHIYELTPEGEVFENIYALRKAKIGDFNAIREWAPMYERIRYEDMLDAGKLQRWLQDLETRYGLVGSQKHLPTRKEAMQMKQKLDGMFYTSSDHCAPRCPLGVQKGASKALDSLFDEELEASLGYHRLPS